MHPCLHARTHPDKPAHIMAATGETVTYAELDQSSNQGAQLFRKLGLQTGDVIAVFMDNNARYLEITWAAQRAGLYFACISSKLTMDEVAYILEDCGAKVLVVSPSVEPVAEQVASQCRDLALFTVGPAQGRFASFQAACAEMPARPIADETAGSDMLYSSGTTGRPKGVKPGLTGAAIETPTSLLQLTLPLYDYGPDSVYLSPAPLYHAAPLRTCMNIQRLGGTVVIMERFDAEAALALIERHRVTTGQFVPTHFVRMLKLPEAVRARYDLSSLETAVHAAAPCPIPVKEQMMAWWGPILHEYYAGTESNGYCYISPSEWLAHKGSVGRALLGELRICDDAGEPLPPRTEGLVYFANGPQVTYHNDPKKTAETYNHHGWSTLGDVGWMDEDGFLYLTDRKSFMIISGGVNIYPQELENLLIGHPAVADAAVVGGPHPDMGEQVIAVIQPTDWSQAGEPLRQELMAFARANLSHVKGPRIIDFMPELPRTPTGKLMKRLIRDAYWAEQPPGAAARS